MEDAVAEKAEQIAKKKKEVKKPAKKQVNKNIYRKLLDARKQVLEKGIVKSATNELIGYKYFELEDIVPTVTDVFDKLGLLALVTFSESEANLVLVDIDEPNENIVFTSPMRYPNTNRGTNEVQALGAAQTYLRRYLYLMALDIVEPDQIEPITVPDSVAAPVAHKPKNTQERKETVKEITAINEQADPLQIEQLKKVIKEYINVDQEKGEKVADYVGLKTKGFTEIKRGACEEIIKKVTVDMLKAREEKANE